MILRRRWELIAPCLFLFVLPIAHTTPFRLTCFGLSIIGTLLTVRLRAGSRAPVAWPPRTLLLALGVWFLVCAVATLRSIEPSYSWGELRNEVLSTLAMFAVFYWLTADAAAWRIWRTTLLASAVAISLVAIVTYQRDGDWLRSSLVGDRNAFSTYIVLIVPFLLLCWVEAAGLRWRRAGVAAALLLALVAGAFTQNRNMWFGIAAEFVAFAVLMWFRAAPEMRRRLRTRYAIGAAAGVLAFAAVLAYVVHQKAIVSRTSTEEQARFDRDPRFEIWAYAAGRIAERPVLGHGYGRGILRSDFRTHFANPLKWHGHNIVVDYGLEAGAFGIVAIVGLFAALTACAWGIYRRPDADVWRFGAWSLAMLLGITIKIMTDDILVRETSLLFWSTLGIGFGLAARRESRQDFVNSRTELVPPNANELLTAARRSDAIV